MNARMLLHACVLLMAGTTSAYAQVDTYLLIPGVPGESIDRDHVNWITVEAMSVGVANRSCSGFTVVKLLDSASPALSAAALSGILYPTMTVEVVKAGAERLNFLTYTLTNVVVGSISLANSPSGPLSETVVLQPGVITISYRPQRADGSLGPPIEFSLTCSKYR